MPYITEEDRCAMELPDAPMSLTAHYDNPTKPGELNYIISSFCDAYITNKGMSYTTTNEVIGVLECAKLELYRRVLAPYEEQKCRENGEVYENAPNGQ